MVRSLTGLILGPGLLLALLGACQKDGGDPAPTTADDAGVADPCPLSEAPLKAVPPHTPRWSFEPWISKDISTRADTYDFVSGFESRGIPVGVVVLDSPWETNYNTFIPHPTRYADFPGMVSDMHARGVKVVLWITPLVNSVSFDLEPGGDSYAGAAPTLQKGQDCNYFVNEGNTYPWWKGKGAGLDFFNPSARAWWHAQQDVVLNAGIDGWKLDFGENYLGGLTGNVTTMEGEKNRQQYSERYYQDFLAYGRSVRGPEFLTMTRAWDESYDFAGRFFAKKEDSPVSWMGDNRRDWFGLADALDESFISARAGYVSVGSDIGGYLDRDDKHLTTAQPIPFDTTVFARWVAVGALSPLMQLHGRANITPWTVPDHADETVAVYKYWAQLHHALVPFMYSLAEETYAGRATGIVRPIGEQKAWPSDYRYMLGDALLVAPILDSTGKRDVALPAGTWFDFFTGERVTGGAAVTRDYSADRLHIPLFVKEGAIVPMNADGDALGFRPHAGALSLLVWPSATQTAFALHDTDDAVTKLTAVQTATTDTVISSRATQPVVARIRDDRAPTAVSVNGAALASVASEAALAGAASGYFYDATSKTIVVKTGASAAAVEITCTRGPTGG
jgi:alpha-glucosidase (family GH31 glycosyl hydrolase)